MNKLGRLGWLLTVCLLVFAGKNFSASSVQEALNKLLMASRANISMNGHPGVNKVVKFGHNDDIDTGANEQIVTFGGAFNQDNLSAENLTIVSTSAADATGGTGATLLFITGIDGDGEEISEIIAPNGLTPVTSALQYKFVNRAVVYTTGSSDYNVGDISFIQDTSGVQLAELVAAHSVTHQLMYYVPNGKECYMDFVRLTTFKTGGGSSPQITAKVWVYSTTQDTKYYIRKVIVNGAVALTRDIEDFKDQMLFQNEIVWVEVATDVNNTGVTGVMNLVCVDK